MRPQWLCDRNKWNSAHAVRFRFQDTRILLQKLGRIKIYWGLSEVILIFLKFGVFTWRGENWLVEFLYHNFAVSIKEFHPNKRVFKLMAYANFL